MPASTHILLAENDVNRWMDAGFRPGSRGPLVSVKVAKTMCAEPVQQLEGASPFDNLMEVKS